MTDQPETPNIFAGFPSGITSLTELPEAFFTELLPSIDDLAEMKVTLYAFWYIQQLEGEIRFMRLSEMLKDTILKQSLQTQDRQMEYGHLLDEALGKASKRGTLLMIEESGKDRYYFINTQRTQAILEGYKKGQWKPSSISQLPVGLDLNKPDIFKLYEQNIGLITPLIAEQIKSAEVEFPQEWIADAISIAVDNNVRRWAYISKILVSWKERGRNGKN